jgi:hypothetical protein
MTSHAEADHPPGLRKAIALVVGIFVGTVIFFYALSRFPWHHAAQSLAVGDRVLVTGVAMPPVEATIAEVSPDGEYFRLVTPAGTSAWTKGARGLVRLEQKP